MRAALVCLLVATVGLAGCADEPGPPAGPDDDGVDRDNFQIRSGTGAISGLLVDDRFRPIHLTDDPQTEYDASGFVLLQETGQQAKTSENGEFTFVDLPPGSYTLRVTASGHEATPQKVGVLEGAFSEVSMVARRVVSLQGSIVTQEYSMFIACAADYVANGGNLPCDLDLSPEAYSSGFNSNLTGLPDASWFITEMKANQVNRWEIQIRGFNETAVNCLNGQEGATDRYAVAIDAGVDYVRIAVQRGVINTEDEDNPGYCPNAPWWNDVGFSTIMFVDHQGREDIQGVWPDNPVYTPCCGVGASAGIKARFLQSVFLGEPEVDISAYCALC